MNYRSNPEESFATALINDKIKFDYEADKISYTVTKKYIPDFYLIEYNFYIEFKGYFRPSDRRKHILVRNQNPDIDIRFVFLNASNKLNKNSKTTYADWCDKYNFKWSEKTIPKQWLRTKIKYS